MEPLCNNNSYEENSQASNSVNKPIPEPCTKLNIQRLKIKKMIIHSIVHDVLLVIMQCE